MARAKPTLASERNPRGAGRKPPPVPTRRVAFRLTETQIAVLADAGAGVVQHGINALIAESTKAKQLSSKTI